MYEVVEQDDLLRRLSNLPISMRNTRKYVDSIRSYIHSYRYYIRPNDLHKYLIKPEIGHTLPLRV